MSPWVVVGVGRVVLEFLSPWVVGRVVFVSSWVVVQIFMSRDLGTQIRSGDCTTAPSVIV